MKIKILCLGRLNKDEENELCKRYESRLKTLKNSGITSFGIDHISKKELENIIKDKKQKKIKNNIGEERLKPVYRGAWSDDEDSSSSDSVSVVEFEHLYKE